ncbi:MAG TPA: transposase [Opitutaceae bacterium]|nr:transposase [Opitutaceae bacterium]
MMNSDLSDLAIDDPTDSGPTSYGVPEAAPAPRQPNARRTARLARVANTRTASRLLAEMPKMRNLPLQTAIVRHYEHYRSVEETVLELYYANLSLWNIEWVTHTLWGDAVSVADVVDLKERIARRITAWRNLRIQDDYPVVYIESSWLKGRIKSDGKQATVIIAIGQTESGDRHVLGVGEGAIDEDSAEVFLRHLKARGLSGVRLVIGEPGSPLRNRVRKVFPQAAYQGCVTTLAAQALHWLPSRHLCEAKDRLGEIHSARDRETARRRADELIAEWRRNRVDEAADFLAERVDETLTYFDFPRARWRQLRTNDCLRGILRRMRERARVVGGFCDGESAVLLAAAGLRRLMRSDWSIR